MLDAVRSFAILEGCLAAAMLATVYARIWRYSFPIWTTRAFLAAAAVMVFSMIEGVREHLGDPALTIYTPLSIAAFTALLAGLVAYYAWTRRPAGRAERHRRISEYLAAKIQREAEGNAARERARRLLKTATSRRAGRLPTDD